VHEANTTFFFFDRETHRVVKQSENFIASQAIALASQGTNQA
jgi:hypothetical protein